MSEGPVRGRICGIDFGTRRVGVAISDEGQRWASPLLVFERKSPSGDAELLRQLVRREEVAGFVVGLPVHMSGDESGKSREARAFGRWLGEVTQRPVVYFDERYSSREADELMGAAGLSDKQRRARRDMLAAQIMLQKYLDTPPTERAQSEGLTPLS